MELIKDGVSHEIPDVDVSDVKIPGIDVESIDSLYSGEMDIYIPVLQSFVSSIPEAVNKLRNVSAETLHDYAVTVHGLKGSCANIGADVIKEKAYALEMKSKAGDLAAVLAQNEELIKDSEKLISDICAWLDGLLKK
ncbi:MAG: Hpt domain-containing protein [Treponema sp.]|jgi:HPt (histidine-containing phosphotransfer) domain-containing protein|nr:Hpt domain-containing protein [Treponema sp.]